LENKQEKNSNM